MFKDILRAASFAALSIALCGCVTGQSTTPTQTAVPRPLNLTNFNTLAPGTTEIGRDWSEAEFRRQITGKTFLRNIPGKANNVWYFAPNNIAYGWVNKETHIEASTWSIQSRMQPGAEKARLFACITLNTFDKQGKAIPNQVVVDCFVPGILFAPFVEHAEGDVFHIEGRQVPPFNLPIERTTIAALSRSS